MIVLLLVNTVDFRVQSAVSWERCIDCIPKKKKWRLVDLTTILALLVVNIVLTELYGKIGL